jgi:hypothetical protein
MARIDWAQVNFLSVATLQQARAIVILKFYGIKVALRYDMLA